MIQYLPPQTTSNKTLKVFYSSKSGHEHNPFSQTLSMFADWDKEGNQP